MHTVVYHLLPNKSQSLFCWSTHPSLQIKINLPELQNLNRILHPTSISLLHRVLAVDITYLLQMFWFAFGVPGTLGFLSTLHHQTQPFPHIQPCFSPFKNKINSALYLIKAILIWLKNWAGYISEGTKELKIKKNVLLQKHFNCKKYWDHVNGFYFHLSKVIS